MITETLERLGYQINSFESSETALEVWPKTSHIAILDINLPGENGLYLARKLREESPSIGVIIMTVRNQLSDKLAGYDAGGDVYLPKPVALEELDAAIQALARRIPTIQIYDLWLQSNTFKLSNRHQESLTLSSNECRLLTAFTLAPENRLEYWELAETLELNLDSDTLRSNLEKRISRLRKKLDTLFPQSKTITALRNYGYQLNLSVHII